MPDIFRLAMPFSGTSPNAPSAGIPTIGQTFYGLDDYGAVDLDLLIQGATGGTLDIYFQSSINARQGIVGARWFDLVHVTQLAAGAAAARFVITVTKTRGAPPSAAQPTSDVSVSGVSSLASGLVLSQQFGDAMRLIYVAGAGTTLGAAQVIDGAAYQL